MNSAEILNSVLFYLCFALIILSAVFTILANRIMHSLLFSVITFFSAGVLFLFLNAEYNAVIQIAVYGIAVPVLFAMAIMFTNFKVDKETYLSFSPRFIFTIIFSILFVLTIFNILIISSSVIEWIFTPQTAVSVNRYEMFNAFSNALYTKFFLSFELVAIIALTVIIGLSTLNLNKGGKRG